MPADQFITVQIDPASIRLLEARLDGIKNGANKAMSKAINSSLTTARAIAARRIGEKINLPIGRIKDKLKINKATPTYPTGKIRISNAKIKLAYFKGMRQTKAGVATTVKKGQREMIKGAFIAKVKGGLGGGAGTGALGEILHTGIFKRGVGAPSWRREKVTKNGKTYWTELPLRELYGPTLLGTVRKAPQIIDETLAEIGPVILKNLASETAFLLSKRK